MKRKNPRRQGWMTSFRGSLASAEPKTGGRRWSIRAGRRSDLLVFIVILLLVGAVTARRIIRRDKLESLLPISMYAELPAKARADVAWDSKWPPLTISGFPSRSLDHVREAYAFAARRRDVMKYTPCYCGCDRLGHRNNEECYVRRRTEDGTPSWTSHGVTCGVCIDITRDTAGMIAEEKPLGEIRRIIDAKYSTAFGRSTPTSPPPAAVAR
jgi:hypothetical protein